MADLRISELPVLLPADAEATDDLAVADYSSSETRRLTLKGAMQKGVTLIDDAQIPGAKLVPDSVTAKEIAPNAVSASELADGSVDTAAIVDLAVTNSKIAAGVDGAKLIADSVTAAQIGPNAVTASELADGAVDTAAVQDVAITNAKLAAGIDGAKLVDGSVVNAKLAAGIDGAKLVDATVTNNKLAAGIDGAKLSDGTVTNAKLAAGIDGAKLVPDSITAREIGPDAITASKLADGSVDTAAVQDAAITNVKLAVGIDGSKLVNDTVPASKIPAASLDRGLDKTGGAIGHTNAVTAGSRNGITFDAHGHITGTAALNPVDLPIATATQVGAVSIPAASGLTVSGVGAVGHASTVAAATVNGITYNATGHITAAVPLQSADIPTATQIAKGGVIVPGPELTVDSTGTLKHADSGVAAGSYSKVTVNAKGHVTGGTGLAAGDIPALDATKINTGVFNPERIADRSISNKKLDNYSVSYIQEAPPSQLPADHYVGQLWYQESTAQLFMWNGNSWMQVGSLGRLGTENMRFSGTWNAATAQVLVVTSFGKAAGLAGGAALPPASDALTGVYLVTTTPGTYNTVPYDNGDWVLCLGATAGWVRVDTLSSAGSSTISLKNLLDVNAPTPGTGDALIFDAASNRWVNRPTSAAKAVLTPPFDGIRTSFALNVDAPSVNAVLLSLGGVVQNPGVDFTLTGARTVNFAAPPPKGLDYWALIEGLPSSGGGGGGGAALPPGTAGEEYLKWNATLGSWQPASTLEGGTY